MGVVDFIKLDINIMDDAKIKFLRKKPEGAHLFELWIGLLCLGMKSGKPGVVEVGDGIPFTPEMLSVQFDLPIDIIKMGLMLFEQLKMIEIWENGQIYIVNYYKRQQLDKIEKNRELSRISSKKYREKLKSDNHVTVTSASRDGHVSVTSASRQRHVDIQMRKIN